jgi:sec-independent protein translocase protein TatA
MPSPAELLVILGIVVLLFGAKKLPELARSMGKASREFRKGAREADEDEQTAAPRAEDTTPS